MTIEQTDIFSMFNITDEVAVKKQQEEEARKKQREESRNLLEEARKKAATVSKGNEPAAKKENDTFDVNFDTNIYHLGEQLPITEYFTTEELENGIPTKSKEEIKYEKITGDDVRKRLEKDYPDLVAAYTEMVYLKKKNMIIAVPKAKKKGLSDSESSFSSLKIPFSILSDFISLAKEYSERYGVELHADIYINVKTREFFMDIPTQLVSRYLVQPVEEAYSIAERLMDIPFKKVMEIHSHHTMAAIPSSIDNESERCPGILYAIVGRVDQFFPELTLRVFDPIADQHRKIHPNVVFENPFNESVSINTDMVEVCSHV
ncbi:Mov34/MPN/PAD-1 family protein [Sutcliffiella horikoshii]|uniref:Mov34/MPN/PAD-1 family protein n=1 Tax=Sutcliffiella horikoshii TaxID=79883 RepID=UPI00203F4420|nr:Mov34/MPN/PAD-1 family protein [Sutcliffiella horikoshii]MCM3619715.1 Mov34/MPN/PAD-1 family protein [Sutcliffiella horikoshii]